MANGLFLAGHAANACILAKTVTVTSENSLFPKTNLQNGFPWKPFKFNAPGTDLDIRFNVNVIPNQDFEADTLGAAPANWTTVAGTPTVETAPGSGHGTKSLRLNATAESSYVEFEVAAYRTHGINVSLWSDGTDWIDVFLFSVDTGEYQNVSGVWSTTKTAIQSHQSLSWSNYNLSLIGQQPGIGHVGGRSRYRIIAEKRSGTGAAYIDDVMILPYITFASMHGYADVPESMAVQVQSSDDDSTYTTRGTFPTFRRHRNYCTVTPPGLPTQWWRFKFTGTTVYAPMVGQTVLGDAFSMLTNPDIGYATTRDMEQSGNADRPVNLSSAPRYRFELQWGIDDAAGLRLVADQMVGGSSHGVEPVVVVPDDGQPEVVYGRGEGLKSFRYGRLTNSAWEYGLSFVEDRFPVR